MIKDEAWMIFKWGWPFRKDSDAEYFGVVGWVLIMPEEE
jgi:hypothetical protein